MVSLLHRATIKRQQLTNECLKHSNYFVVKRIDSAHFLAGSLLSFFGGSNELRQCTVDCIFWNNDELDLIKSSLELIFGTEVDLGPGRDVPWDARTAPLAPVRRPYRHRTVSVRVSCGCSREISHRRRTVSWDMWPRRLRSPRNRITMSKNENRTISPLTKLSYGARRLCDWAFLIVYSHTSCSVNRQIGLMDGHNEYRVIQIWHWVASVGNLCWKTVKAVWLAAMTISANKIFR